MKKVYTKKERSYRSRYAQRPGELSFRLVVQETDLQITATLDLSVEIEAYVRELRKQIEVWCKLEPNFRTSLTPLPIPVRAPEIIRRMSYGAQCADVGPFAAVAGTIAQLIVERFVARSPNLIVENGGDTYIASTQDRIVGLLADPEHDISINLRLAAADCPVSLCASSSTIGHSLSLGQGELAVVRAPDAAVADAVATALCNRLQSAADIEPTIAHAQTLSPYGVQGVFLVCDARMGIWGMMELASV